jgi:formamidopyrimidine-DNA glycosylase
MPELPDVENYTRFFNNKALGKKIFEIESSTDSLVRGLGMGAMRRELAGKKFSSGKGGENT